MAGSWYHLPLGAMVLAEPQPYPCRSTLNKGDKIFYIEKVPARNSSVPHIIYNSEDENFLCEATLVDDDNPYYIIEGSGVYRGNIAETQSGILDQVLRVRNLIAEIAPVDR